MTAPLSRSSIYIHGSIGLPIAMFGYPVAVWLPPFYAGELGVSLAAVGTMIMLARLTDVVTDPLIGFFSDRTHTPIGRRKPFMLLGLPILMIGVLFLFMPHLFGFSSVGSLYLLAWLGIMFIGSTLVYIPYFAWGAEMSPDYHERSRITASREFYVLVGLMVAALIPALLPFFIDGPATPKPVLTAMGWTIIVLTPLSVLLVCWRVAEPAHVKVARQVPLLEGLRHVGRNGPMVRVLAIVLIVTGGEAFRNALSLFFMRDYIGVTGVGMLYLYYFGAGLLAIPGWLWLGRRMGKHKAFAVCMTAAAALSTIAFFLEPGQTQIFTAMFVAKGLCFGGLQFLPLAMLADVIDVDTARSKGKRAGTFFAISGMTTKLATAFGTGISLNVVAFFGFNPVPGVVNGPAEFWWLAFSYAVIPSIFFLAALWLTWTYPLTAARQVRLRGLIERRNLRLAQEAAINRSAD